MEEITEEETEEFTVEEMEIFVEKNITEINAQISNFSKSKTNGKKEKMPSDIEIKKYLLEKFNNELPGNEEELIKKLREHNYTKTKIVDIANEKILYNKDLEKYYRRYIYNESLSFVDEDKLVEKILETICDEIDETKKSRFIITDLKKLVTKYVKLIKINGFAKNLTNVNDGTMVSNSGDSAQFLFLARSIQAGYNCSNVDVRTSAYDSIIDYKGRLLKIQVKGITDGNILFKNRDRGGVGVNHKHSRNIGKYITSDDCDIYVAVDTLCGLCYLIPTVDYIDKLTDEEKGKGKKPNELSQYLEAWDQIEEVATSSK